MVTDAWVCTLIQVSRGGPNQDVTVARAEASTSELIDRTCKDDVGGGIVETASVTPDPHPHDGQAPGAQSQAGTFAIAGRHLHLCKNIRRSSDGANPLSKSQN
jgi:hypothetical protein